DRPNPIDGLGIEGNILERGHESFVGMYPIPMRHGMTAAELARMFNEEFGIGCDLEVVPMRGYKRRFCMSEMSVPSGSPSPNMPTPDTAAVYPGTVFVEGTKISEGRGTARLFEINGAPYANSAEIGDYLNGLELPGVYFRPHSFLPTFQKHKGSLCHG